MPPADPLAEVRVLLAAASTAPDVAARAVYIATARAKLDALTEGVKQTRWLLETIEGELARQAAPVQTSLATEGA